MGKVFAIIPLNNWEQGEAKINLKCNPERAIELREEYERIEVGWHMNKKHWNTILLNSSDVSNELGRKLIIHSYNFVVNGLTKKHKKN